MTAPTPRRRPDTSGPPPREGLAAFIGEHGTGLAALAVVALAVAGGWLAWVRFQDRARGQRAAILLPEDVEVIGVGDWVQADLRSQALRDASLDGGVPLDDPELARRLARAFGMHPWVREVVRVTLRHPAGGTVEVRCREPVAMIAVPGGLLAVDAEATLLPSEDFTAESAAQYPKVVGVASGPRGAMGLPWGDPVVAEAAALAAVVGPEWRSLSLTECRPAADAAGTRTWELVGPDGVLVRFGAAPGHEREGEPTAALKVSRLRKLAAAGPLAGTVDLAAIDDAAAVIPKPNR